ncbi:hypothetical protein TNCV_4787971 [Trichonephila clavipes]|nr:hypothetical protein TNCV_4787971 [Trichonephila clavipes]
MSPLTDQCGGKAVFNIPDALGTSNFYAFYPYFQSTLLNQFLPALVREGFSLDSLTLFTFFLFLLFGESFHFPPPMDLSCLRLTTSSPTRNYRKDTPAEQFVLFCYFTRVDHKLFERKRYRPVATPWNYPQGQSDRSIDRPSKWYNRLGEEVDFSHTGLLCQKTNGVGMKRRSSVCRSATTANQILLGCERGPSKGFKGSTRKPTTSTPLGGPQHLEKIRSSPYPGKNRPLLYGIHFLPSSVARLPSNKGTRDNSTEGERDIEDISSELGNEGKGCTSLRRNVQNSIALGKLPVSRTVLSSSQKTLFLLGGKKDKNGKKKMAEMKRFHGLSLPPSFQDTDAGAVAANADNHRAYPGDPVDPMG